MGQYWIVANLDKEQFIDPNHCGDLAKLMEFMSGGSGMLACLAVLLADGNGEGGGDLGRYDLATGQFEVCKDPIIGSWAGDRIVLAGDYSAPDTWLPTSTADRPRRNLYQHAGECFTDVSAYVVRAICQDGYFRERYARNLQAREGGLLAVLAEAEKPLRRKRRRVA